MRYSRRLIGSAIIVCATLSVVTLAGSTTRPHTASPAGYPLFAFAHTNADPFPWDAVSLSSSVGSTTMVGTPQALVAPSGANEILYQSASGDCELLTVAPTGNTQVNLTTQNGLPPAVSSPRMAYQANGHRVLTYNTTGGDLIAAVQDALPPFGVAPALGGLSWPEWTIVDLSVRSGLSMVGQPSITAAGGQVHIIALTSTGTYEDFTMNPDNASTIVATNVSAATGVAATTSPPSAFNSASDALASFAYVTAAGHLEVLRQSAMGATTWTGTDVTAATSSLNLAVSGLGVTNDSSHLYVAGVATNGDVVYDVGTISGGSLGWTSVDATSLSHGPALNGQLFVGVSNGIVTIAGQAANWGDLFVFTSSTPSPTWTSVDASATGGSAAKTVTASTVGFDPNGTAQLFSGGVNTPPPSGTGVYAIPSNKWASAITDQWPIVSETGALGTTTSPWVGLYSGATTATTPDFQMGMTIQNSHQRRTWLSYWTVSGPMETASDPQTAAQYYQHGLASGMWVGNKIASYRSLGLAINPDWVIFDPEGYPDRHSNLDCGPGCSAAQIATYSSYWSNMLSGWQAGLASANPSLHAAFYATQSEYTTYHLAAIPMPIFMAVAFSPGQGSLNASASVGTSQITNTTNSYFNANQPIQIVDGTLSETNVIKSNYDGLALQVPLVTALKYTHTYLPSLPSTIAGAGSTYTLTYNSTGAQVGDSVQLSGAVPTSLNGAYSVTAITSANSLTMTPLGNQSVATGATPLAVTATISATLTTYAAPRRLSGVTGTNILGFIAFNSFCYGVQWERSLFTNAPFNGTFNSLQFPSGQYCSASTP